MLMTRSTIYLQYLLADSMSLSSPPGMHSPKGFENSHVPKEVRSLSEHLQNLIMGRVVDSKTATRTRKIVIYICAADSQGIVPTPKFFFQN